MGGGIERFEHHGTLVAECQLPGETLADAVVAAHPNGLQLSANRWLILYATRQFRGNDDDCSIVYQIRADRPDGDVLTEGMLARSVNDWQPEGPGTPTYVKQHGSPTCFGVPKGARIGGRPALSGNLFVLQWRRVAREYDARTNRVEGTNVSSSLVRSTQVVEYCQVCLNAAGTDLEILQPPTALRQQGFADGPLPSSIQGSPVLKQNKQAAVPYTADATEWVAMLGFSGGRYAPIKWRYDEQAHRYRWVQTGSVVLEASTRYVGEAELARHQDYWVAAARTDSVRDHVRSGSGVAWVRLEDPFSSAPAPVYPPHPPVASPVSVYACADGVLRYFGGSSTLSPYGNDRDPLYCWDIDPDRDFAATNQRLLYDTVAAGLPFRPETAPKIDMPKLLPPDGDTQYLLHRVSCISNAYAHVHVHPHIQVFPRIRPVEMASCAIYCGHFRYAEPQPPAWSL